MARNASCLPLWQRQEGLAFETREVGDVCEVIYVCNFILGCWDRLQIFLYLDSFLQLHVYLIIGMSDIGILLLISDILIFLKLFGQ